MYSPRVSLPSREGEFSHIFGENLLSTQHYSRDDRLTAAVFAVAWVSLIADSPIDSVKPTGVIVRFVNKLSNDLFGTIALFSDLAYQLTLQFAGVDEEEPIIGPFMKEMKGTPVFREYLHFYRTRDPHTLRYLMSFLSFGKKLTVTAMDVETVALRDWLDIEDRLGSLELPAFVENLRPVLDLVFQEWVCDYFLPKHGSGAVAEQGIRGVDAKNHAFPREKKVDYLYNKKGSLFLIDEVGTGNLPSPSVNGSARPHSREMSRLKFVPKTWKKVRSICMEPIIFQWAQQGVRLWYEEALSKSVLKNHIFLHDQTKNQQAAMFGSLTQQVDTVDLSSASDSVAWELVRTIFPPKVLKHLLATRTSIVELPNGGLHKMQKFAPMGSGLCFPVQSTIYSAVVIMVGIAQRWGVDWKEPGIFDGLDLKDLFHRTFRRDLSEARSDKDFRFHPFYIYGDDIIVDHMMTSNVVEALRDLGFTVNGDKSYTGSLHFRESCGGFYHKGSDVTPLLYKAKPVSRRIKMESLVSFISLANRAKDYEYLNLRRHLIQFILHWPIKGVRQNEDGLNPVLFTNDRDESCAILSDTPYNSHLKIRWYTPDERRADSAYLLQRDELKSVSLGPVRKRRLSEQFDNYRYLTWWRSRYHGSGDSLCCESEPMTADTMEVGAVWRWSAIPS